MKLAVRREIADALFMGTDGSMGFQYGQMYRLNIRFLPDGMVIVNVGAALACPYSNIETFFTNWWVGIWRTDSRDLHGS